MHTKVITIAMLLVYVGFTTAVPSPVAEGSPAAETAKDNEAQLANDSKAQPRKRSDVNEYNLPHFIQCNDGDGLYKVRSVHHNRYQDRWFDFSCRHVTDRSISCHWTSYFNDFNEPLSFMCPANRYLGGIQSYHENKYQDRRFRFQCCSASGLKTHECFLSGYLNDYNGYLYYSAPIGYVFTGMSSVHDNGPQDRKFKFLSCKLS